MVTVGSLFSGIGGIDLGLERAGMRIEWQVEIDEYANRVLAKHWPNVKRYGDVRECGAHNLAAVDLICGGFPCQPHSLAGKRRGSEDDRDLWGEFARIIGEIRPRWVLAENVLGLLSSESGRFFGRVLRDLAACGYDAEWDCIPAAAVGAPHLRYRVFLIAHSNYSRGGKKSVKLNRVQCPPIIGNDGAQESVAHSKSIRTIGNCQGHEESWMGSASGGEGQSGTDAKGNVAYAECERLEGWRVFGRDFSEELQAAKRSCTTLSNANCEPSQRSSEPWGQCGIWAVEPGVGRVVNGVSARMDRLRCLGNAVVPQIVEVIGRRIVEIEEG